MRRIDQDIAARAQVRDEGLAWVELLVSGQATAADTEALRLWRARSPHHAHALGEAMRLLRAAERLAREPAVAATASPSRAGPSRRAMLAGGAIAAGVGGLMLARPPAELWPSLFELMADARTGIGERRSIALAEGVGVELNTRTSVAFSRGRHGDGLDLIAGEAMVESARADGRPVFVTAGGGRISAAGAAAFNVRRDAGSACVTCTAGRVTVEQAGRRVDLGPRQQVVYSDGGLGAVEAVDPAVALAWRRGFLIFRDTPLDTVVGELNRYRAGRIVLANGTLARRSVYGAFRTDRTDAIITQIQQLAGARVTRLPGGVVLLS